MARARFVFGKDMSDEQMWQAFKKFAEGVGFTTKDTHKNKVVSKKAPPSCTPKKKTREKIKG